MTKQTFLERLSKGLHGLPQNDINERISFYSEMIDDQIEEGISEEEAIDGIGNVEDIITQTKKDYPATKIVEEKVAKKKKLNGWEITLLALGSPLWLALLIATVAVLISIYAALWSIIISLWSVFVSLIGCTVGGVASSVFAIIRGYGTSAMAIIGLAIICAGLSIFLFFGCREATKGILTLTKKTALWVKNRFRKKEEA